MLFGDTVFVTFILIAAIFKALNWHNTRRPTCSSALLVTADNRDGTSVLIIKVNDQPFSSTVSDQSNLSYTAEQIGLTEVSQ